MSAGSIGRALWVELPVRAARYAPAYASAATDGQYLLRWPVVPWLAPLLAVVAGVLVEPNAAQGGFVAPHHEVFTSSLLAMIVLFGLGCGSVQLGSWALLGYVVADQATGRQIWRGFRTGEWWYPFGELISATTEYVLLGIGAVGIPMLVLAVRVEVRRSGWTDRIGPAGERLIHVTVVAGAYYAWCQATISAIGTVFTSLGQRVPAEALEPVQQRWTLIIGPLCAITIVRWIVERTAFRPQSLEILSETTDRYRHYAAQAGDRFRRRTVGQTIIGLVLLGGIIEHTWQTAVTTAILIATALIRRQLPNTAIGRRLASYPLIARIAVVTGVSFLAVSIITRPAQNTFLFEQGFTITWATILTLYTIAALATVAASPNNPTGPTPKPPQPPPTPTRPVATSPSRSRQVRRIAVVVTGALLTLAATPTPALADDCSSPSDCFGASQAALIGFGLLLVVLAVALVAAPALIVATPALMGSSGILIGATVTIPAGALTAAGIATGAAGAGIIGHTIGDTIAQASQDTGSGRNDPHGDAGRRQQQAETQIAELEAQLAELQRTQGPKKDKRRLREAIKNLRQDAERARKGETHGRRAKGQR